MQKANGCKRLRSIFNLAFILILCTITALLDIIDVAYCKDAFYNGLIAKIVQQGCGALAGILILLRLKIKLFSAPKNLLYLIPCFIVAIDNFQFGAYFSGKMHLIHTKPIDFILFFGYCLCVGLFEEVIFRGVIFSVIAGAFSNDRKGWLKTYVASSIVFGLAHLFNGFSLGTLLQVGYTVLTGGLFAFCLIKTKNILCCALVHGIYNFLGLLFDVQGLGNGVVFDVATVVTMTVVSIVAIIFVVYNLFKYSEEERIELYTRLGIEKDNNADKSV